MSLDPSAWFKKKKPATPTIKTLPRAFRVRGPGSNEWVGNALVSFGGINVSSKLTEPNGHGEFQIPVAPLGQKYSVFVDADGYRRLALHEAFTIDGRVHQDPATVLILSPIIVLPLTPVIPPAVRLHVNGVNFQRPDGSIFKWAGATGFTGLEDWIHGDHAKLTAYAKWLRSLNRNTWRVFGMWSRTGFDPRDFADYYIEFDAFLRWLAKEGLYCHYTALCDQVDRTGPAPGFTKNVILSSAGQELHLKRAWGVMRQNLNAFGEVDNEDFKNGIISARFPSDLFAGVLSTRSSHEDGQMPDQAGSILDFTSEHTPRDGEWERKAKNLAETSRLGIGDFQATKKPAVGGEPMRIGEDTTPRQWADYSALGELFASGITIHGGDALVGHASNMQRCQVPTGQPLACAEAAASVCGIIPADVAGRGEYAPGHLGNAVCEQDGALKSYAMIVGADAWLVRVRETTEARLKNGWRKVERKGPDGQIYRLER